MWLCVYSKWLPKSASNRACHGRITSALAQGRTSGLAEGRSTKDAPRLEYINVYSIHHIYTNVINPHNYEPFFCWSWSLALNISRRTVSSVPPMEITWKPDEPQDIHWPAGWKYREHASHKVIWLSTILESPHPILYHVFMCIYSKTQKDRKVINIQFGILVFYLFRWCYNVNVPKFGYPPSSDLHLKAPWNWQHQPRHCMVDPTPKTKRTTCHVRWLRCQRLEMCAKVPRSNQYWWMVHVHPPILESSSS